MTAECYECATAGEHEGSELLRGMMRIFADGCEKCECNVTHYAKKKSEAIPAERKGRAGRSREKMNEQYGRMILVSNLNQSLLSHCLSAFSSVLTEMPLACAWCESMGCIVAVPRAPRRGAMT